MIVQPDVNMLKQPNQNNYEPRLREWQGKKEIDELKLQLEIKDEVEDAKTELFR